MSAEPRVRTAIVDYGMGNLFSVKRACEHEGMDATITSRGDDLLASEVVILPGVGAFGDAMETLRRLGLVALLREIAESDRWLVGICLGMQLFMQESREFGRHEGLGIIPGDVVQLPNGAPPQAVKVPQVGWNRAHAARPWAGTWLDGMTDGAYLYFVHSFYVRPADPEVVLATTRYGPTTFCSVLQRRRVVACQAHPERSGPAGLRLYRRLVREARGIPAPKEILHA